MEKTIAFISGHRDVTPLEFANHYAPQIVDATLDGCLFVVGDYHGADYMSQLLLKQTGAADDTTVFHMFTNPRNYVEGMDKSGGFISDVHRDFAMTLISDFDICWVREGKEQSGTAQNIERRKLKDNGITDIV